MKRRTKVILGTIAFVGVLGAGTVTVLSGGGGPPVRAGTVEVAVGTVVEKAIASGTIEPSTEVEVKSKVSGVVRQLVGALPEVQMKGRVTRIALRSTRTEQSVGFPVEIEITDSDGAVLRAGYSASAEITVRRADDALLIPERLITYAGDTATVMVEKALGEAERRVITTGVSDAVNVQVLRVSRRASAWSTPRSCRRRGTDLDSVEPMTSSASRNPMLVRPARS